MMLKKKAGNFVRTVENHYINNEFHISFEREMTTIKELVAGNKGVRNYDVDIICIGF